MKLFDYKNLPPVGLVCEVNATRGRGEEKWIACEILTHYDPCEDGDMVAVYAYKTTCGRLVAQRVGSCFREVKNKEQIEAEEEREKTVAEMVRDSILEDGSALRFSNARKLYDAGWRK